MTSAIVTGGAGGIGRQVAIDLAQRGAAVAIWDADGDGARETAEEIVRRGGVAVSSRVDVTSPEAVFAASRSAEAELGVVTTLVTTAGYSRFVDFASLSIEEWSHMLTVHATGTFLCAQAVHQQMKDQKHGRMVFLSSVAGISGSAGHVHYAAAKAAIIGFTKALAKELGPHGITVNALAPGAIDTPMLDDIPQEVLTRMVNNPVGRIGQPGDVSNAVLFLTHPNAGFITGTVLNVSGGVHI